MMNLATPLMRLTPKVAGLRALSTSTRLMSADTKVVKNFDPNNYNIPLRYPTMDDMMEPYGSWKVAYAAEKRRGNLILIRGIFCMTATLIFFYHSGVADGLFMPNLDNIMEETVPFPGPDFDKEGRVSV